MVSNWNMPAICGMRVHAPAALVRMDSVNVWPWLVNCWHVLITWNRLPSLDSAAQNVVSVNEAWLRIINVFLEVGFEVLKSFELAFVSDLFYCLWPRNHLWEAVGQQSATICHLTTTTGKHVEMTSQLGLSEKTSFIFLSTWHLIKSTCRESVNSLLSLRV